MVMTPSPGPAITQTLKQTQKNRAEAAQLKQLERNKKAREEKQRIKNMTERGYDKKPQT